MSAYQKAQKRIRQWRELKEERGYIYDSDYSLVHDLLVMELRRTERLRQEVALWRKKALQRRAFEND